MTRETLETLVLVLLLGIAGCATTRQTCRFENGELVGRGDSLVDDQAGPTGMRCQIDAEGFDGGAARRPASTGA